MNSLFYWQAHFLMKPLATVQADVLLDFTVWIVLGLVQHAHLKEQTVSTIQRFSRQIITGIGLNKVEKIFIGNSSSTSTILDQITTRGTPDLHQYYRKP